MTRITKKEQLILNRIARKRISDIKDNPMAVPTEVKQLETIKPGRPKKYDSPEQMNQIILDYIEKQNQKKLPCTLGGVALELGMDVRTLRYYEKKDEYYPIIRYYRDTILVGMEEKLLTEPKLFNSIRYYMNNNFSQDYQDRIVSDVNVNGSINILELHKLADDLEKGEVLDGEVLE